jgi:hypothetical protein
MRVGPSGVLGRLKGESEPKIALEMDSTNDRSERAREPVCTELLRARVPTKLLIDRSIPSLVFPRARLRACAPGAG